MISTRKARNTSGRLRGYGGCHRCGDTWDWATHHDTQYSETTSCFPLCETCWRSMTPEDRLPYYFDLLRNWLSQATDYEYAQEIMEKWPQIKQAVMEGK